MRKKQTEQSSSEIEKSRINLDRAEQLRAILDSDVFNEAVEDLKAELLIRTTLVHDKEQILELHKQIKAISLVVENLRTEQQYSSGEYN